MNNLLDQCKNITDDKCHPKYKALRDLCNYDQERKLIEEWANDFTDKDNKFKFEFQKTFHSCIWELYINQLLKESKLELNTQEQSPDFIGKNNDFYIEAVVANINDNGEKEYDGYNINLELNGLSDKSFDEAVIRNSNALTNKLKKLESKYEKKFFWNKNAPFIVALGSYDQLNYGNEFVDPLIKLLYDIPSYNVIKTSTLAKITTGIFLNKSFEKISGIVFSCTNSLGKLSALCASKNSFHPNVVIDINRMMNTGMLLYHDVSPQKPEFLADGVFIFENPNAINKIPNDFLNLPGITRISFEENDIKYSGTENPIFRRIVTDNSLKICVEEYACLCVDDYNTNSMRY